MRAQRHFAGALVGSLAAASCSLVELRHPAPLAVRNQHPVQLTAPALAPRAARPTPPGRLEGGVTLDWSNTLILDGPGADRVVLDGEMLRATLRVRAGVGPNVDVDAALPLVTTGGGVLDRFIEHFHDGFGLANDKRRNQTTGRFDMGAQRRDANGQLVDAWRLEREDLELGDVPVTLTWAPEVSDTFTVGVRMGVELPAGDEGRGYGNGGVDGVLGLLAQWDGAGISAFGWVTRAFVARAERARVAGLAYDDVTSAGAGVEIGASRFGSILVQLAWESSLLRDLDDEHASGDHLLLWLGARLPVSAEVDVELAMSEDLLRDVSPDVTFHAGVRLRL